MLTEHTKLKWWDLDMHYWSLWFTNKLCTLEIKLLHQLLPSLQRGNPYLFFPQPVMNLNLLKLCINTAETLSLSMYINQVIDLKVSYERAQCLVSRVHLSIARLLGSFLRGLQQFFTSFSTAQDGFRLWPSYGTDPSWCQPLTARKTARESSTEDLKIEIK